MLIPYRRGRRLASAAPPFDKRGGVQMGGDGIQAIFDLPLQSSLVPAFSQGSPTPTFTRATTAYVLGYSSSAVIADGPSLILCASGEARFMGARRVSEGVWSLFDANGVRLTSTNGASTLCCDTNGPFGYVSEGARTNVVLQSQTFATTWVSDNIGAISEGATAAPDGTATADTITASAGNTYHLVRQSGGSVGVSGSTQSFSVYVKKGTNNYFFINSTFTAGGGETYFTKVFDVNAGTLGESKTGSTSGTISGATITALPNGWYRCTVTGVATNALGGHQLNLGFASAASGNVFDLNGRVTFNAAGTETLILWGAQGETATFATNYIPTTVASVTRNADVLTYPITGNFNNNSGSVYLEATFRDNVNQTFVIGSNTNKGLLSNGGAFPTGLTLYDGTTQDGASTNTLTSDTMFKIAGKWGGTTKNTFLSGVAGVTPGVFDGDMNFVTSFTLGGSNVAGNETSGTVRNVRIYNRDLSDSQLQIMTA